MFPLSWCRSWRRGGLGFGAVEKGTVSLGMLPRHLGAIWWDDSPGGGCPGHRGASSSLPGLHHSVPGASLPTAVRTTNVCRQCQSTDWVTQSPPFESCWTEMTESGQGRALHSCSPLLFLAKRKPGASCQPCVCRLGALAQRASCRQNRVAAPGDEGLAGNVAMVQDRWLCGF